MFQLIDCKLQVEDWRLKISEIINNRKEEKPNNDSEDEYNKNEEEKF